MCKVQLCRKASILLLVLGSLVLGGCSSMMNRDTYVRTYYQDMHGRYYINMEGQRVYLYDSVYRDNSGRKFCMRDCHGRYYTKDSFGNVYYMH